MNYFKGLVSNMRGFYSEINSATLTGAIDVIVIRQEDGSFLGSPFHVRFGKLGVLRSREKIVDIMINGEPVDLQMKLGDAGEAFFVEEVEEPSELPRDLITTPIPSSTSLIDKIEEQKDKEEASLENKSETTTDDQNETLESPATQESNINKESEKLETPENEKQKQVQTEILAIKNDKNIDIEKSKDTKSEVVETNEKMDENQDDKILNGTEETIKESDNLETKKEEEQVESTLDVEKEDHIVKEEPKDSDASEKAIDVPGQNRNTDSGNTSDELDTTVTQEDELSHSYSQSIPIPGRQVEMYPESDSNWMTDSTSLPKENEFIRDHRYPLSDLDSPIGTPPDPRDKHMQHLKPFNPQYCLSDTEAEIQQSQDSINVDNEVTWDWGKLPKGPENGFVQERKLSEHKKEETSHGYRSKRKDPYKSHKIKEEGIYLDDLNSIDQEVAALYLNQALTSRDDKIKGQLDSQITEDRESGIGQSLPSSPTLDLIGTKYPGSESTYSNFAMSLCGDLKSGKVPLESFVSSQITYDDLSSNPTLLNDPKLVIRINDRYYNWQIAAPMLMSYLMFQRPLKQETVQSLVKQHMPKKEKRRSYYWFSWRPNYEEQSSDEEFDLVNNKPGRPRAHNNLRKQHTTTPVNGSYSNNDLTLITEPHEETSNQWQRQRNVSECSGNESDVAYKKSTRLNSENLAKLNLHDGANSIRFSVTTKYQGTAECQATIYLWNYDDRIIISDIDGTITKSDVLGQILPVVGQAWAQSGVAHFFSSIDRNGYKLLYLSARAIGQAQLTRDYLKSVKQDQITLPDGPLLLSPASLIKAFHREVIEKKPEEFKIAALRDIQSLFPCKNPFYGGFGNKINDVLSYRAVGVSSSRIFTINHKGEVRNELITTFQSSYLRLSDLVDHMFPPYKKHESMKHSALVAPDEFSSFTYWRNPLPEIDLSEIVTLTEQDETAPTA